VPASEKRSIRKRTPNRSNNWPSVVIYNQTPSHARTNTAVCAILGQVKMGKDFLGRRVSEETHEKKSPRGKSKGKGDGFR